MKKYLVIAAFLTALFAVSAVVKAQETDDFNPRGLAGLPWLATGAAAGYASIWPLAPRVFAYSTAVVPAMMGFIAVPWVGAVLDDNNKTLTAFWAMVCGGIGGTWHPERNNPETVCEGGVFTGREPK